MSSILLRPSCPAEDDPEIRRLLELIANSSGATFVELELEPPGGEVRRYRLGRPTPKAHSQSLELRNHRGALRLGGVDRAPDRLADLVAYSLDRILLCLRFSAQVSILRAALDTTTSAVLLFDHDGDVVYANPPADALLSRQTEADVEGGPSSERLQPLFTRVWSMVEKVLDGRVTQLPWTSPLVLSDGSVVGCEIMQVGGEAGVNGVAVLALLQPLTTLPSLFLEAFCARHGVSRREQEVIGLLLEGRGTAEMASRLSISEYTVRDHLKRLYRKTGTRSRSELISVVSTARMEPAGGAHRR
jgi:DNA-binding CsgD family transcriptional regulator/PAS domain-containing protein